LRYKPPYGAIDLISLGNGIGCSAPPGLPHILVRFYTVPDAKKRRAFSVVWAMALMTAIFYTMTTFLASARRPSSDGTSSPRTRQQHERRRCWRSLGGDFLFAFISSTPLRQFSAVVADSPISCFNLVRARFLDQRIHHGTERKAGEEVRVARVTAFVRRRGGHDDCDSARPTANVAFLVALAFAVAASAKLSRLSVSPVDETQFNRG